MRLREWHRVVIGGAAVVLATIIAGQLLRVAIDEQYSQDWHSHTADEAAAKRLLVARVPVTPAELTIDGRAVQVQEAWVEPVIRTHYRYYLFRRQIQDSVQRLIVSTKAAGGDVRTASGPPEYLAFNDSAGFASYDGSYWIARIKRPYPDTIRLFKRLHW